MKILIVIICVYIYIYVWSYDYLYYYTFESTFDLDDEEQRPKDVPTLLGGGNDYDKFVKVTYIINNIYNELMFIRF